MQEPPKKIKIVVKPSGGAAPTKKVNIKEEPIQQQPKRKKGLLRKILDIVSKDIRKLIMIIRGERKPVKKMPKETDSWEKWKEYFDMKEWKPKEEQ